MTDYLIPLPCPQLGQPVSIKAGDTVKINGPENGEAVFHVEGWLIWRTGCRTFRLRKDQSKTLRGPLTLTRLSA